MATFVFTLNLVMESATRKGRGLVIEPECSMAFFMEGNVMGEEILRMLVAFVCFVIAYVILYVFG